jgi:transcriptional regulator with XRE-family HTH domain
MDITQQLTLGEKIRNFRKRAGMSQLDLEVAIDAATGSISRIESGKVNPTKETILQVGKVLNLKEKELEDLLEIRPLLPTPEEIQSAIVECKKFLDSQDVLAYLIDENAMLHAVSKGFINFLSLSPETLRSVIGKNILEVILDPQYGISQHLDQGKNLYTIILEIARITREASAPELIPLEFIKSLPHGPEILKQAASVTDEEVFSAKKKQTFFLIDGQSIKYNYSRERLKYANRFELIDFFQ